MKIELREMIKEMDLNKRELSLVLFPKAKHPAMALTRLISGRSKLNEQQIYRLSIFTGIPIEGLYKESLYWKTTAREGLVYFTKRNYRAIYDPSTGITKVYSLDSLLATHVVSSPMQPLSDYLTEINSIIINSNNQ